MTLPIDSRVLPKIKDLVSCNVIRIGEVQRHLEIFVKDTIFADKAVPPITSRRFFPSRRDIGSNIYAARQTLLKSRCDQENVSTKVNEWKNMFPKDKSFFRPLSSDDSQTGSSTEIPKRLNGYGKNGFLFIYQTAEQSRLLQRYGNDICLLDATYRTTKYAMPFFQLCVKTNVDYQVVAVFVTQFEDSVTLSEPLDIIRQWNTHFIPTHFMVDFAESEINALEKKISRFD